MEQAEKLYGIVQKVQSEYHCEFSFDEIAKIYAHTVRKCEINGKESDYIPSLCWVGDTSKGFVLIDLENALNLTGANFTFVDKGEGTLPFEFQAHAKDLASMKYAPVTIVFFNDAEGAEPDSSEQTQE